MEDPRDKKVVFAFARSNTPGGEPVLTFLIPDEACEAMRNGIGADFDLTRIGLPLKVVIGRTQTHATGIAELEQATGLSMKTAQDVRDVDVSFDAGAKDRQQ